jgi:chemotaxis protein MotB
MQKVAEADGKAKELETLQQQHKTLTAEKEALKAQKDELDKRFKTESTTLSRSVTDLQRDNARLRGDIEQLKKKEIEIKSESTTYQNLVKEMKGEIAKGEITIRELKGKLTLDVVDKILFQSGDATVKKEGLQVLKRVVDILKNVQDKAIRIEGHTDNKPIRTARFPSNWELSAARALNVTRYLHQQGIEPAILSAVAFGEYQPVADNATAEGRAKNRRIAIVLVPRD